MSYIFSWYNQKISKGEFFKLIKNIFEKVSEVRKKWKLTFEISIWVKTYKVHFVDKCVVVLPEVIFFRYNQEMRKWDLIKTIGVIIVKQISEVRKKWKTKVLNFDLNLKIAKYLFLNVCLSYITFFLVQPKGSQMRVTWVGQAFHS